MTQPMDWTDLTPEERVEMAEDLIGEMGMLVGGGGVANEWSAVRVVDVKPEEKRVVVDDGQEHTHRSSGHREPVLKSWCVLPLHEDLADILDPGKYISARGGVVDADSMGLFGSIYDGDLVAEPTDDGWKPVEGEKLRADAD